MFLLMRHFSILVLLSTPLTAADPNTVASIPDDFPRFVVPGHEQEMESLRRLFWLHYQPAGPLITLWDEWMPMSTLWPAMGGDRQLESMRMRWAAALASRGMNTEGYVHTHQHDGPAHAEGWPFPLWMQAGGIGWHFRGTGVTGYDAPPATPAGWTLTRATGSDVGEKGWEIELTEPQALAQTPPFAVDARVAPWLRLNWWAAGLEGANCYLEWTTNEQPAFSPQRRMYFAPATRGGQSHIYMPMGGGGGKLDTDVVETRTMIPVYRLSEWKGTITGIRIGFGNAGPAKVVIKSFHTACDTRHNINNSNFIRGCHDYFQWSADYTFLRDQIGRIRSAMRFMMREFDTRSRRCVYTIGTCCRLGVKTHWEQFTTTMPCWTSPHWRNRLWRTRSGAWPPEPTRSIRRTCGVMPKRSRITARSDSGTSKPGGSGPSILTETCTTTDSLS
jgi:hypothetical protein